MFCNVCISTYCVSCSDKLNKPIKNHDGISCEDVQSGTSLAVTKFVREIQESILNLRCPKCTTPFYDFSGCAAVKCDSCKGYFCGLCLQLCENDGEAHTHVINCPENPSKDYFVAESTINEVHRSMRKEKIRKFVAGIRDPKIRNKVCIAIKKDLNDLGIEDNFIKSLALEETS